MTGVEELFLRTIRDYSLINPNEHILTALSGGVDSVALLYLLRKFAPELGITLSAVHVDHGLRGDESRRDREFSLNLCRDWGVDCRVCPVDVGTYRRAQSLSVETAARELRYRALRETARELGADKIAVGHHADDLAETMFMRLGKGTGVEGLAGIPVRRDDIIRPLLYIPRSELLAYAGREQLPYIQDSSNQSEDIERNRVRKRLIPVMESLFPAFREKMTDLSRIIHGEQGLWEELLSALEAFKQVDSDGLWLDKRAFAGGRHPALLRRWVRREILDWSGYGFYPPFFLYAIIEDQARNTRGNRILYSSAGYRLLSVYDRFLVQKSPKNFPKTQKYVKLSAKQILIYGNYRLEWNPEGNQSGTPYSCRFASQGLTSITVRGREPGDWLLIPQGQKQVKKKLQDLFVDNKLTLPQREESFVLADNGSKLVAVFMPGRGFRVSRDFYVEPDSPEVWSVVCETIEEQDEY